VVAERSGRAARQRRVLALHVEVWDPVEERRAAIAARAAELGFSPSRLTSYARTIWIDLRPGEADVLASLHATARRHIRVVNKAPVAVKAVDDDRFASRMETLMRETMGRTGGAYHPTDWRRWIRAAASTPRRLAIQGLFRTDVDDDTALLGYAIAVSHGDVVEYSHAASTRDTDLKVPILYAPTWELMRWAIEMGASTWDFGGVTMGTAEDDDPRGGISDFKRYFSQNVVQVGAEFVLEPSRTRSRVANALRFVSGLLRR